MPRARAGPRARCWRCWTGEVVGCGSYEVAGDGSRSAEVALAVADDMHSRGVGTLLLEHLVSLARSRGVRAFIAETLSENALMMQVFADAGLQAHRALADGVYDLTFPLPADEARRRASAPTAMRSPSGSGRPTWRACGTC